MKKLVLALLICGALAAPALADSGCTTADLIGLGVNDQQAAALGCDSLGSDVLPAADDTYDLGSTTYAWQDVNIEGDVLMTDAGKLETTTGELTVSTDASADINLATNSTTRWTIEAADGDLVPETDDNVDVGASAKEIADLYVDGIAHIDTVDVDVAFGSDVALSINTTDLGLQADTSDGSDDQTVNVCGGGGGTGCDAETRGAWLKLEGADVGGAGVGGAVNLEAGAGDGTADVTIATNHDDADIILRGGTTQATRVTVEGDTGATLFQDTDGGIFGVKHNCVTTTTNSGAGTQTLTGVIPAGVVSMGVSCRVDTILAGTGLTTWSLGDGTDADLYGTGLALTVGTTVDTGDYTASPTTQAWSAAAGDLTMTAAAGQFDSGAITCCAHYFDVTAPSS